MFGPIIAICIFKNLTTSKQNIFLAIIETFVSEFLVFFFCHQMFLKGFNSFKSPSTYFTIQNFARWHTYSLHFITFNKRISCVYQAG